MASARFCDLLVSFIVGPFSKFATFDDYDATMNDVRREAKRRQSFSEEPKMLILLLITTLWAIVATWMVIKNPLPFPDRGHRLFGVPSRNAQKIVLEIMRESGLPLRFRFRTGPTDQALLWDNTTAIHLLDQSLDLTGNGISIAVRDPESAALAAIERLETEGFTARRVEGAGDAKLPPNHLVVLTSDAFRGWVLVFRRHQLRMPKPTFLSDDE